MYMPLSALLWAATSAGVKDLVDMVGDVCYSGGGLGLWVEI